MITLLACGLTLSVLTSEMASSSPWPQFRGPSGSGIAREQNPPTEIGPNKNVKWKVAVPRGLSSPVVAGDNIILTAFDAGKLYIVAYRRTDGTEAWRVEAHAKQIETYHKIEGSPAASTPVTDGVRIFSYFGSCGLFCHSLAGKELWKHEMPTAITGGDFGSGVSPIIAEGAVILVRDQLKDSKIIAFDSDTGTVLWKTSRQSPMSFSTPVFWKTPGNKLVVAAGHASLIGYDLTTGAEKWSIGDIPARSCPSPVIADGMLFFAGTFASGPDDKELQIPIFDDLLKEFDKDKDGLLTRAEGEKTFQGFFDNLDGNKNGNISRDEWDAIRKGQSEGKSAAFALEVHDRENTPRPEILWNRTKGLPTVASAILYRGQYVMVKDGGIVTAYDQHTGDLIYQKRAAASGPYYASPVAANDHIFFTSLLEGEVTVLRAGGAVADVVARNPPLGERVAATPAIADSTLYIRTSGHLYAFANSK